MDKRAAYDRAVRYVGRLPLAFDIKVFLLLAVECVFCVLFRLEKGEWMADYEALVLRVRAREQKGDAQKVAVVTGGSRGIGREAVAELCRAGYFVFFGARDRASGEALEKEMEARGHRAEFHYLDLLRPESVASFCRRARLAASGIDLLLCNSGTFCVCRRKGKQVLKQEKKRVPTKKDFIVKSEEYMGQESMLLKGDPNTKVNYLGHFFVIRGLAAQMRKRAGRLVIVSSSLHFLVTEPFTPPRFPSMFEAYCQSKYCCCLLGLGASIRYKDLDVRVAHPGMVRTGLLKLGGLERAVVPVMGLLSPLFTDVADAGRYVVHACLTDKGPRDMGYHYYMRQGEYSPVVSADPANDLWEASEVLF